MTQSKSPWRFLIYVICLGMIASALLPFLLMVVNAFQETRSLSFAFDPERFTLDNFVSLFQYHGFGEALLTSVIVVVIAVVLNAVVCSLAAFAFAFKPFPGSKALLGVYLLTMMVPAQVTIIPLFIMFREMGILGSHLSLALPIVTAFGVFLIHQFMQSIPFSLIEAARIDGASDLRIFISIIVPAIRPALISLTVFTFLTTWNDFLWPLVSLQGGDMTTVTVAVASLRGAFTTQYGMVMAGTTVAFLVPFLVYVVLQRQFVAGVTSTGLKG